MNKKFLKKRLASMVRALPWGGKETVLATLTDEFGSVSMLRRFAAQNSVIGVEVEGKQGRFLGSIHDTAIVQAYMKTGAWADRQTDEFMRFFEKRGGGTFLDVGANIGLTLVPIARLGNVQCTGFEPEPNNFRYLRANLALNGVDATVLPIAAFDKAGHLEFSLSKTNMGDHRVMEGSDPGAEVRGETIRVRSDRLDDVISSDSIKYPLAIKIDTQGAEPRVFAGGRRVLSQADLVVFEFWPGGIRRADGDVTEMLDLVGAHFRVGRVTAGEQHSSEELMPIAEVLAHLRDLWGSADDQAYFDVMVSK